ncbi:MAG: cobyric acid synthase CobQ, partial [Gammaproteobacteria bacterium]|nr:cobyric acid synthase CobQ [Gammaproteobacteria bacterium]
ICGGYQMLGQFIHDPEGIEAEAGSIDGFSLLEVETTLIPEKQLKNVSGILTHSNAVISGYEIHSGITSGPALKYPAVILEEDPLDNRHDGAVSADDQIMGTYLHGLFEEQTSCQSLLEWAGLKKIETFDYFKRREDDINRLADTIQQYIDVDSIFSLLKIDLPDTKKRTIV